MYQTTRLMALVIFLLQSPNSLANESILVYSGDSIHPSQLLADILKANPQMEVVQAVWEASTARAAPQSA